MAGGGHGFGFPPRVPLTQHMAAKAFGAVMWFWVFWRAKQDGPVLLVSLSFLTPFDRLPS